MQFRVSFCVEGVDDIATKTVKQLTSGISRTCVVTELDWRTGAVTLVNFPSEEDEFTLARWRRPASLAPVQGGSAMSIAEHDWPDVASMPLKKRRFPV